jgi:S1-C subfamily serine protease
MRTWISCCFLALVLAAPGYSAEEGLPAATLRALKDATVFIKVQKDKDGASGSGFLFRVDGDTGYVVTNHHVVTLTKQLRRVTVQAPRPRNPRAPAQPQQQQATIRIDEVVIDNPTITVVFSSGTRTERSVSGQVIAADRGVDLAIIKLDSIKDLPKPIDVSKTAELSETLPVFALGFPLGQMLATSKGGPAISISKGSITSVRRNDRDEVAIVQIDSDLNPGNSGGPVVDSAGRLVGISVAKVRDTKIGLAIPPRELQAVLDGRPGEVKLTLNGASEVLVEVTMADPFERVKSLSLLHAAGASASLSDAKASNTVALSRQGIKATGSFSVMMPDAGELQLACQMKWTDKAGLSHTGEVHNVKLKNSPKAGAAPEIARMNPAAPGTRPTGRSTKTGNAEPAANGRPAGPALSDAQLTSALEDLLDPTSAQRASELLARSKPDGGRRDDVLRSLRTVVGDKSMNVFARSNSIRAIGVWGSDKEVEFLVPLAADENIFVRREALDALSIIGGKKAAETIADRVDNFQDHSRVLKCLERMGPAAEEAVVASLLASASPNLRLDGCNLLKSIGTDRSLKQLEDLARSESNDLVKSAAAKAVKAIKERRQTAAN